MQALQTQLQQLMTVVQTQGQQLQEAQQAVIRAQSDAARTSTVLGQEDVSILECFMECPISMELRNLSQTG